MMTIFGFSHRQAFGRAILAFIAVTFSLPTAFVVLALCVCLGSEAYAVENGVARSVLSLAAPETAELVYCTGETFKSSVPQGKLYEDSSALANKNGIKTALRRRIHALNDDTVYGHLNNLVRGMKEGHPDRDIALVAFPDSSSSAVRAVGSAWSVPVVDLSEGELHSASPLPCKTAHSPVSIARPGRWHGRRVAFLGDSITDARHIGCTSNYWNFLERDLGIVPLVYGINGHQFKHLLGQAEKLYEAHSNAVDEIVVFAGTNDFNANVPLGDWADGEKSFRGRIAAVMDYCESHFPGVTVWFLTPIHRGYATFGAGNVQPDETYANTAGLWISDYVDVVTEAAAKWGAARLIDMYAECGLYPLDIAQAKFFHNARTDMLHPNTAGHARMAKVIARRFLAYDATTLVQARLAALPPEGGTLYLAKDTYHFYENDAKRMWLDPSNNQSGEKYVVFPLVGRKDVTIDGCGSTFVFHGRTFPFAATNCTGLTFRNFTVTTRYPSCPGFVVKEKDKDGFTVKFDERVCPYRVDQGNISFSLDGNGISTYDGRLSLHLLDCHHVVYLMAPNSPGDKGSFPASFVGVRAEDIGNREVRFTYYGDRHPKSVSLPYNVGAKVVINLEEKRYRDVFFFEDCDGVAVENVVIRRFGGMGIVGQRSGNIKVEGLSVYPHEGERVTVTADIVQFINCYGKISIIDCEGGLSRDDWINIHGNYLKIVSAKGRCLRVRPQHPSQQGFFPYRPGDMIECVTARERSVLATARVCTVAKDPANPAICEITVDADLSGVPLVGHLVENITLNPDVTIRNCRFSDFPHLRLSGRGKYLIEGNRFEHCIKSVLGMDLADYWFESGRILDMTIRNNSVVDGGGFSFGLSGWSGNENNIPKVHGRISLDGNIFNHVRGAPWSAVGVGDFNVKR